MATITIKAGEDVSALYKYIYQYPAFTDGKVLFKNGEAAGSKLNYNYFLSAMQFIDNKGDTLAVDNEENIEFVAIGDDTFYYQANGFLQLVSTNDFVKLAKADKIKFSDEQNIGAYGLPNSTHAIERFKTFSENSIYQLLQNRDLIFTQERKFYFRNASNDFIEVSKKTLLKKFTKQRSILENYLEENKTDLTNEDSLKTLFAYLAGKK